MKKLEYHHWNENSHKNALIDKKIKSIFKRKKVYQEQNVDKSGLKESEQHG